jgi:hypothetical protein
LEIRLSEIDGTGQKIAASQTLAGFIHELLHAVDIGTQHCVFAENDNACEAFAQAITQILVDNFGIELEV